MVDINRPRHGSLGFRPRKRASTQNVRVNWLDEVEKRVVGFAGYKVGMTHVSYTDQTESSTKGQELMGAATILEVPPMMVYGIRYYDNANSIGDVLTTDEKILTKINFKGVNKPKPVKEEDAQDIRLLAYAQPDQTFIGKKHPESMEIGLGGADIKEKIEYAKTLLGKELKATDVFKPGEFVDVAAVTKGKGWQGAIKRFGCSKQRRKATGQARHIGTLGAWTPNYVLYTVPQAGQMGYHTRTEINKKILKLGTSDTLSEINPNSGFTNYGFIKKDYIVVKGSIPGPSKRLVKLRLAGRATGETNEPQISYVSVENR